MKSSEVSSTSPLAMEAGWVFFLAQLPHRVVVAKIGGRNIVFAS